MIRYAQSWLGTLVAMSVEGTSSQDVVTASVAEIARLHRLMHLHDGASDIAHFNRKGLPASDFTKY